MLQITPDTSPQKISEYIAKLREQKGKEKEVLQIIKRALTFGHGFVINLFVGTSTNLSAFGDE